MPQARTGHVHDIPRGRVVGGSGSINAMAFLRGDRRDFDTWQNVTVGADFPPDELTKKAV